MLPDITADSWRGVFMRRIDELKKEIIHEILNSEEYREYRRLQSEINRTPDLKRQVDEFRMRNLNYRIQKMFQTCLQQWRILIRNMPT